MNSSKSNRPLAFAAMPYALQFEDVFYLGMVPAAASLDLNCVRVDRAFHGEDSVQEMKDLISKSALVIADVTNALRNVMYEIGYADAVGVPVIQLCSRTSTKLPFVIRNRDTIHYSPGQIHLLSRNLTPYIKQALTSRIRR